MRGAANQAVQISGSLRGAGGMVGTMKALIIVVGILIVIVVVTTALNLWLRRRGYAIPGRAAVRCKSGHLFRTLWIEGGALTAIRLGPTTRYMRCPVGRHWSIVHPVKEADLTAAERATLD